MLTSLDFLEKDRRWPPPEECERLEKYQRNKELFEGEHYEVYAEEFARIQRVIGNFEDVISYHTILNYQKLISLKTADLLLGEAPTIKAGDEQSAEQETISLISEKSELINTAYEVAIDVSRLGTGLFLIYKDDDEKGIIDITQPDLWFPVVSPDNIKKTLYHVLGWTLKVKDNKYLKIRIHSKGFYEERIYSLNSGIHGDAIDKLLSAEIIQTGLSDYAVVPVHNVLTSDRIFGIDDYTDIDTIISDLCIRCSQVSKILDEHANPSMSGPVSTIRRDPNTGRAFLEVGKYFPIMDKNEPEVKYITWDGQLAAAFQDMEVLVNHLYIISEMGSAIFGDMGKGGGQVASGTALRRLMMSALAKVNRVKMHFDPALKKAVKLCSQLGGEGIVNLTKIKIDILWQDGLPNDPVEEATMMNVRTAGKATISQRTAIKKMDNLSEDALDEEIGRIEEESMALNPLLPAPFSQEKTDGPGNTAANNNLSVSPGKDNSVDSKN